ncbi:MAG: hypothetical protein GX555_09080 [Actinomycetales bacterium]|nr:hypothetical protein [Actinomycetales bacterium]
MDTQRDHEQFGEQLRDRLQDLPPDLADPVDRFGQVRERVRRRRSRHTAVAVGGVAAAVALAVPVAAQLLPETAQVVPGGGTEAPSVTVAETVDPQTVDVGLGGTRVTHLSEPITTTGTGTVTVQLGEKPEGATGVAMTLDCLSAGEFTYPDGAGLICDDADAGTERIAPEDFEALAYVVSLAKGSEEFEIRATEGSSWRLTTSYVSTEVTDWGVNAKGETYGVENIHGSPDLIAVIATNGQHGYAYVADMNAAWPEPTSPEHALELQEERGDEGVSVPVYESDGETVIGEFVIGGGGEPADLGEGTAPAAATVTAPATSQSAVAEGSGCAPGSSDAGALPDGEWYGLVVNAGGDEIEFDLACWFFGEEATLAAAEDGHESPDNDYYVRNQSDLTFDLSVVSDATVTFYPGDPGDGQEGDVSTWLAARANGFDFGIWVEVESGEVVSAREQWRP